MDFGPGLKNRRQLYWQLDDRNVRLGVGVKSFSPAELQAYRLALEQASPYRALGRALYAAEKAGGTIEVETLKRAPSGTPDATVSLYKGLFVWFELPAIELRSGDELLRDASECFRQNLGVYEWLIDFVSSP